MADSPDYEPKDSFFESILFTMKEFKILTPLVKDTNEFSLGYLQPRYPVDPT